MHRIRYDVEEMERHLRDNMEDCINKMKEFVKQNILIIEKEEKPYQCII